MAAKDGNNAGNGKDSAEQTNGGRAGNGRDGAEQKNASDRPAAGDARGPGNGSDPWHEDAAGEAAAGEG